MDPQFETIDSKSAPWQPSEMAVGVEVKSLGSVEGRIMELYRLAPDTSYPDHIHQGPEFVYMLEGEATQNGQRLGPGWASAAGTGTLDKDFRSGGEGCTFLTVYSPSRYLDR
ncbi:MAG: cupin domain-containing protein [Alphaproteobacteria bacterium]|nr:cupin domain-containing protein [Alphaproteobacteria bacterium]MCZ6838734.1 cupin domain-containing protein [Alphaproteobacteria bacterium]